MLKIQYLSHSAFILDDGKYRVIIDPFLSGNPNAPIKWEDVDVQYIILTHAHSDHFGDTLSIAKENDATVIAVNELSTYTARRGVKAHFMHIGGSWNFPFGKVKFTQAFHGSSLENNEYMGEPAGVIISMGGINVYHTGDTGLFGDMKLIGELNKIDVMLCPIGDNFTMGIDDAVVACEFVRPRLVVPMHYNTFPLIQADPDEFVKKLKQVNIEGRKMEFGETINFE
ncbi:MAG TPA: metal-dependent hydrolase [Bacteroidota bacterium]|nr:metal-dependent hydrolase [Candidatus Kapabacteria bacterium]HRS01897.1 metal-dependent hydrolase [Bacteroidota bacterium]HRT67265.1 metal-dependent hydrolase [Bacteroidota bacterium]